MSDALFEKYQTLPTPINFEEAKKTVRDKELVGILESFYKSTVPAPETYVMPEAEKLETDESIAYLTELESVHKEFLPVLEAEIEFQLATRSTMDTTVFDMKVNHPLMHEEIEDEIEKREWFKDIGLATGNK